MPWYIGCWGYMLILAEMRLSDRIMGLVSFYEAAECICGNVGFLPFFSPSRPEICGVSGGLSIGWGHCSLEGKLRRVVVECGWLKCRVMYCEGVTLRISER